MSLKVLLDPILTSKAPASCSTYIQFKTFVDRILATRDDVFFIWIVPEWVSDDDMDWLPDHPNVRYVRLRHHRDRMIEYVTPTPGLLDQVSFDGPCWDYDVLLTVRSGLVPMFKMNALSPRQKGYPWSKEVWVIEEMPLMEFKESVATVNPQVQDLYTLPGYIGADRVFIISHHEKAEIVTTARRFFAPSQVRAIDSKIQEVVPVQKEEFQLKDPDSFYTAGQGYPFCVAYAGRLMAAHTNLDKIYSAMTNQWIWKGQDNVRLLVMTPSTGGVAAWPPDHIEVQHASRDEFWRVAKEEMHVVTVMHDDGGFSLSLIEPMMLGVPAVVLRAPWSEKLLGSDYPFFVKNEMELYATLRLFYDDYAAMYEKYRSYFEESFKPLFKKRFTEDLLYARLDQEVDRAAAGIEGAFYEKFQHAEDNQIVASVLKAVEGKDEFHLLDELKALGASGELETLQRKLDPKDREIRGMVWKTPWNDFRLRLKALHGFQDASPALGHFKRP